MVTNSYLALCRGINVGGKNIIKMKDIKNIFQKMYFTDIITYIQSGNIIFTDINGYDKITVTTMIEAVMSKQFNYEARIVLLTGQELIEVMNDIPPRFGEDTGNYRYDVWFLKEPLTATEAIQHIRIREGVDTAYAGKRVIYTSRLISLAGKSYLSKIIQHPMYRQITIRNWNTAKKLWALMGAFPL